MKCCNRREIAGTKAETRYFNVTVLGHVYHLQRSPLSSALRSYTTNLFTICLTVVSHPVSLADFHSFTVCYVLYEFPRLRLCPHQCTHTLVLSFCVRRWLTLTTIFLHLSMAHKSHSGFDSLDGGASPLTSTESLHWTAMQSVSAYGQQQLQPPLDQFREEDCNCKRSQGVKGRNGF